MPTEALRVFLVEEPSVVTIVLLALGGLIVVAAAVGASRLALDRRLRADLRAADPRELVESRTASRLGLVATFLALAACALRLVDFHASGWEPLRYDQLARHPQIDAFLTLCAGFLVGGAGLFIGWALDFAAAFVRSRERRRGEKEIEEIVP
jgi:hypothetical protein